MTGIFSQSALELRRHGLAVLPAEGKSPLIAGFPRWRRPPSERAVAEWQKKFPDANIGYIAGHSGLVVVDADSLQAADGCREIFGTTPGRIRTRRGEHMLYRAPDVEMPRAMNLRTKGLDADLKHGFGGQSIAIAPPSQHPEGGQYSWIDCDALVLRDLPPFRVEKFCALLTKPLSARVRKSGEVKMRDGSRKQWLNDRLCGQVAYCDDLDELIDVGRTLNDQLADSGSELLDDLTVIRRAKVVWNDWQSGKIKKWHRNGGAAEFTRDELRSLENLNQVIAPDALMLLGHFRIEHSARCRRGETFSITPKAMESAEVIRGWTRQRYEKARNLLLDAKLIELISPRRGNRIATQYRLAYK